jgi:BlaR1 peptidase M56
MPPILVYLLRLSISLAAVWLFYQLLLRRLTFYALNRWYLLGYSVLSFFIPLINIYPILRDDGSVGEPYLIRFIPVVGGEGRVVAVETHSGIGGWTLLLGVIGLGALVLMIRTVMRGASLYRLRKSARLIESGPLRIYQVDASIIPFSFGHSIYINQDLHTKQQWSDIILHEYVHIRQRHTVDILMAELMCMLNWYNPFCWLIRWSIRQNLEFIADQQVLAKGVDKKGYQYHLLTALGEPRYRLANNFNFSSLKKRIVMMNKIRSARLHLLRFLFVLPLAGVLLVAFRDKRVMRPVVVVQPVVAGTMRAIAHIDVRDTSVPRVRLRDSVRADALYVLNGEKMPPGWNPNVISADKILSVDVVKGEQAVRLFGPRGANGVIAITLKSYELHFELKDTLRLTGKNGDYKPVYVLEGREVTAEIVGALDPNRIEVISVHKADEVTRGYGEKGKNGVIIITLKKDVIIVATPDGRISGTTNTKDGPVTVTADTLRVHVQ